MLHFLAMFSSPNIHLPGDFKPNFLMITRWIHFLAGITWIGLLYFFNLVNIPFRRSSTAPSPRQGLSQADAAGALVVPDVGVCDRLVRSHLLGKWSPPTPASRRHFRPAMGSFFGIWTAVWAILYALLIPGKGVLDKGPVIGVIYVVVVFAAAWCFLSLNDQGWQSNRLLSIGIGGGIGWVMMLNVWGVIWRIQKRLIAWTKENAANGTPIPEQSKRMARMALLSSRANAYLSIVMLFFMGAASHYPMFGK